MQKRRADFLAVATRLKEGMGTRRALKVQEDTMHGSVIAFAASDCGRRRARNEDAYLLDGSLGAYFVADGMGGASGGDVASKLAVTAVHAALEQQRSKLWTESIYGEDDHPLVDGFRTAVRTANTEIRKQASADPTLHGMGTTFTGLTVDRDRVVLAHVGDSRAYRVRGQTIEQISRDHTLLGEMVRAGTMRADDVQSNPWRHVLARAVGAESNVDVDVDLLSTRPGDIFVLCSDGLANVVEPEEIRDAVLDTFLKSAPSRLIRLANERGGPDNITVVVVCITDTGANDGDAQRKTA